MNTFIAIMVLLTLVAAFIGFWILARKLYIKWYLWDRQKQIESMLRAELRDEEMFQEAADKILRERGMRP